MPSEITRSYRGPHRCQTHSFPSLVPTAGRVLNSLAAILIVRGLEVIVEKEQSRR